MTESRDSELGERPIIFGDLQGPSRFEAKRGPTFDSQSKSTLIAETEVPVEVDEIQWGKKLAEGETAEVFKGKFHGKEVAIKRMKHFESKHNAQLVAKLLAREINTLKKLDHPNIVRYAGSNVQEGILLTEFVNGICVYDLLHNKGDHRVKDAMAVWRLSVELADAMKYLHDHNILYRDLKSENLIRDKTGRLKLIDFDLSREVPPGLTPRLNEPMDRVLTRKMTGNIGTFQYAAPEILKFEPYNASVDVYSYGALLWEVCTGLRPFSPLTPNEVAKLKMKNAIRLDDLEASSNRCAELCQLIHDCCTEDARRRPTFDIILDRLELLKGKQYDVHSKSSFFTRVSVPFQSKDLNIDYSNALFPTQSLPPHPQLKPSTTTSPPDSDQAAVPSDPSRANLPPLGRTKHSDSFLHRLWDSLTKANGHTNSKQRKKAGIPAPSAPVSTTHSTNPSFKDDRAKHPVSTSASASFSVSRTSPAPAPAHAHGRRHPGSSGGAAGHTGSNSTSDSVSSWMSRGATVPIRACTAHACANPSATVASGSHANPTPALRGKAPHRSRPASHNTSASTLATLQDNEDIHAAVMSSNDDATRRKFFQQHRDLAVQAAAS